MTNLDPIMAILDERMKAAEKDFLNHPDVIRWKAKQEHMIMEHGTMEPCQCPGLNYGWP